MSRPSPAFLLVVSPVALAACGSSSAPTDASTRTGASTSTSSGMGGATGAGGASTTTSSGAGGTSGPGGAGPSGGGGQGGAAPACTQGTVLCEGAVKKVCDGQGGFDDVTDCAAQGGVCVEGLGCAACQPGTGSCAGDLATFCKGDGSGFETETCDALQGTSCDAATGRCTGACSPKSLGKSYIGCDYYPTVTANLVSATFSFAVAVSNTTGTAADVTITRGAKPVASAQVPPHSVKVVPLPWVHELKGPSAPSGAPFPLSVLVKDGAYRLRSTQPVTVYQFNPLEYHVGKEYSESNDASLLLPQNAWTGTYFVSSRGPFLVMSGFYAVTASEDQTTVTVKAGANVVVKGGVPGIDAAGNGQVVLDAGDVMEIVALLGDPTGTEILADKPVQVISGHQCTNVPALVPACDHLEESMFPFETLSTSYLVTAPAIPTLPGPKVEMVRIIATADATSLVYDPPKPGAPASIAKAGEFVELANDPGSFQVTANHPILVVQTMEGENAGGGSGDPAMTLAVAKDQFRSDYLVHAPTNYETSYANVVAPTGVDVTIDGAVVQGLAPIGATGYSGGIVKLSNAGDGDHTATAPKPFGIQVYGYGQFTSYWYPGGSNLVRLHE